MRSEVREWKFPAPENTNVGGLCLGVKKGRWQGQRGKDALLGRETTRQAAWGGPRPCGTGQAASPYQLGKGIAPTKTPGQAAALAHRGLTRVSIKGFSGYVEGDGQ
ncbi:MAG: hypothetical protein K0Q55_768 [Verrucomicrobia bacterium]|jgi:hypothetical protein|nr:hypothetical protein [Verrucomicrobiota bacterium]